jgi:hypothetical protein
MRASADLPAVPEQKTEIAYDSARRVTLRKVIVVDSSNQVVAIQLVDEQPKDTSYTGQWMQGDWLTYNFVGYRVKLRPPGVARWLPTMHQQASFELLILHLSILRRPVTALAGSEPAPRSDRCFCMHHFSYRLRGAVSTRTVKIGFHEMGLDRLDF